MATTSRPKKEEQSVPANTPVPLATADEPVPAETKSAAIPSGSAESSGGADGAFHGATELSFQPIPGATVVGRGIYIKPRQPYELKAAIFDQELTRRYTSWETGESYLVPANCLVNNSPPAPADQSLGETVIEESWDRFSNGLTLNINAAVSSKLISIDPTAFRASDLRSEEDSYYALRSSFIAFWNLSMISVPGVPTLEQEVGSLISQTDPADPRQIKILDPLDPSNRAAYARIFEKYGSHYVKSAWVGGKASLAFVVAKSSQLTKDEIRAGIQAAVGGIVSGGMSRDQKTVSDKFKSNSTCKVFGSGGDRLELAKLSSLEQEAYGKWIQSVKNNPQVIQLGLAGIWTLVKDPEKAEALKKAYIQESSFKPLTAIIPVASRLYFVKDDEVFEYRWRQPPGEPKTRRTEFVEELRRKLEQKPGCSKFTWPDTAISLSGFGETQNGALYLFKHRQCLRLDVGKSPLTVVDGYPKDIGEEWPGVDFDRVDAALAVAPDRIYFFRGSEYIRVDMPEDMTAVVGTRDLIKKRWAGVSFDRVDTAVYWGDSKVYLFYGDQYIRYDMATFRADPGYPRFIQSNYVEDWEIFE